jgi:hypothetical protein
MRGVLVVLVMALAGQAYGAPKKRPKPPKQVAPAAPTAPADKPAVAPAPDDPKPGKLKSFDFEAMGIEGKVLAPQILYLLGRIQVDLQRSQLEKRSFVPEMVQSIDQEGL